MYIRIKASIRSNTSHQLLKIPYTFPTPLIIINCIRHTKSESKIYIIDYQLLINPQNFLRVRCNNIVSNHHTGGGQPVCTTIDNQPVELYLTEKPEACLEFFSWGAYFFTPWTRDWRIVLRKRHCKKRNVQYSGFYLLWYFNIRISNGNFNNL